MKENNMNKNQTFDPIKSVINMFNNNSKIEKVLN